jgi:hypothetical protein
MTRSAPDAWVQQALAAAKDQTGDVAIQDPATLDALAELLAHADHGLRRDTDQQHADQNNSKTTTKEVRKVG